MENVDFSVVLTKQCFRVFKKIWCLESVPGDSWRVQDTVLTVLTQWFSLPGFEHRDGQNSGKSRNNRLLIIDILPILMKIRKTTILDISQSGHNQVRDFRNDENWHFFMKFHKMTKIATFSWKFDEFLSSDVSPVVSSWGTVWTPFGSVSHCKAPSGHRLVVFPAVSHAVRQTGRWSQCTCTTTTCRHPLPPGTTTPWPGTPPHHRCHRLGVCGDLVWLLLSCTATDVPRFSEMSWFFSWNREIEQF